MSTYNNFLASKKRLAQTDGVIVNRSKLHPSLKPFQADLVTWSLRKGRAALFTDTGTGKTLMQLEWARHAAARTLILAPLSVALQTEKEALKWDIPAKYARSQADSAVTGITITNYEMLKHFDVSTFGAVVLDESSILKSFDGKTRTELIEAFSNTKMRLACTATPAPNDISEIANHAEFLGIMTRLGMLATFFVHDDEGWRLKGHAYDDFFRWLASWAMSLRRPSDLGYSDEGYVLPELSTETVIVGEVDKPELKGITDRLKARKDSIAARVQKTAELILSEPSEPYIAWCGLNEESASLTKYLKSQGVDVVEIKGSDKPESKAKAINDFASGKVKVLVTKATIAGFGLNFQHCARMVFVGLGDSFEQYYQATRRCWRYGQTRPVKSNVVLGANEQVIYDNVLRKQQEALEMTERLVKNVAEFEKEEIAVSAATSFVYKPEQSIVLPTFLQ